MRYTVVKELKSTAKYNKYIELKDLMFILIYFMTFYFLRRYVYIVLHPIYFAFTIICAFFFVMKTPGNPERKNYQRIIIMLRKKTVMYKPVKNYSKQLRGK